MPLHSFLDDWTVSKKWGYRERDMPAKRQREDRASPSAEGEEKDVNRDVKRKAWIMTLLWFRTPLQTLLGLGQWWIKSAPGPHSLNKIPSYASLAIMMFNCLILVREILVVHLYLEMICLFDHQMSFSWSQESHFPLPAKYSTTLHHMILNE